MAIIFVLWAIIPAFYVITLALSGGNTLTAACPQGRTGLATISCLIPTHISFKNFSTLFTSDQYTFLTWLKNTLIIATVNSFGALIMGAAAAYAFSRQRFTGRRMGMLALRLVQFFF